MRNRDLHDRLRNFAERAREHLDSCVEAGAEIPFEVAETPGATSVLYHYRPLSSQFVRDRFDELQSLDGAAAVLACLAKVEGAGGYLRALGVGELPMSERERVQAVLNEFLGRLWQEVTTFDLEDGRFERAYRELESALYEDTFLTTVLAPVLGVRLEEERWELGSELALARGDLCDAPAESVWAAGREEREPNTLAVLSLETAPKDPPPLTTARVAFRKLLTTLRLFKPGPVALGPTAWWRVDDAPWQSIPLAYSGRPRAGALWLESAEQAELSELFRLVQSRSPERGALAWALARFEMGCERPVPMEGLSDHLLAVRALLAEDEAIPAEIASRVAALCAEPQRRVAVAEKVEEAFKLERQLMRGRLDADYLEATGSSPPDALAIEIEGLARSILRDMVCGYLEPDVKRLADELQVSSASAPEALAPDAAEPEFIVRRGGGDQASEAEQQEEPGSGRERNGRPDAGAAPSRDEGRTESEQATEETVAVGGVREAAGEDDFDADWGFDDDPSDYSAAI